jgi:hypothetical protein
MIWKKAKLMRKGKKLISPVANGAEVSSDNGKRCLFTHRRRRQAFSRSGITLQREERGFHEAILLTTECHSELIFLGESV